MIGVNGKFISGFSIADKKDFLLEDDLIDFSIYEQVGNVPPVFSFTFLTGDDEIINYINEGNTLKVLLGSSLNDSEKYEFIFQNSKTSKVGNDKHLVVATGIHNSLGYLDTDIFITDKMDGSSALKLVGNKFFKVISNIDQTSDTMYWNQHSISHKRFINNIWLSTYIPDSFPLLGITATGELLIKDAKKVFTADATWDLVDSSKPNFIQMNLDYLIESRKGFFSNYVGSGRNKFLYDQDEALGLLQNEQIRPFLALANKLGLKADRETKNFANGVINENVHANYHKAQLRNLTSLAQYSSVNLSFNFNSYKKIKLFDTINFKETNSQNQVSSYSAGKYIVCKKVTRLQKRSYIILIETCRESFNLPKGDLK